MLTLVVGLGFAVSTPLQLTTAVLSGLQRYDMVSIVTVVILTFRTMLTVVLLLRGYGLVTLGLIYGISEIVARGVQHILARRLLPKGYASWRYVDRTLLKEMLFYGMNTFLYAVGAMIIYRASETIAGIYLGPAEVSQLWVAAAGLLLLSEFVQAFTTAIKPAVSDLDTRDDQEKVRLIAFLTQKYSLLILIPAAAFLMIMGREFLTVWIAPDVRRSSPCVQSMATILTHSDGGLLPASEPAQQLPGPVGPGRASCLRNLDGRRGGPVRSHCRLRGEGPRLGAGRHRVEQSAADGPGGRHHPADLLQPQDEDLRVGQPPAGLVARAAGHGAERGADRGMEVRGSAGFVGRVVECRGCRGGSHRPLWLVPEHGHDRAPPAVVRGQAPQRVDANSPNQSASRRCTQVSTP